MQQLTQFIPDIHMWFSLLLIGAAVYSYAKELISMELTSIMIIAILLTFFHFVPLADPDTGRILMDTEKLLAGFANPALLTVLCLLVLGQAVVQTGALNEFANIIVKITGNRAWLAIGLSLFFVMAVSAFLNNTPVVVIFIPIMAALVKGLNISVSRVMIPLSFASILGGMVTLIGSSTNLLVSGVMEELGEEPLNFFDFTIPGMVMASVGFVYVVFILPRILPDRATMVRNFADVKDAEKRQFVAQIEIDYSSDLVGQKIEDGKLANFPDLVIRMLQRGEHAFLPPFDDDIVIRPRDILVIAASKKDLGAFFAQNPDSLERHFASIGTGVDDDDDGEFNEDIMMAEIVVSPSSKLVGKNLEQSGFRQHHNCVVLGIERQSKIIRAKVTEIRLAAGDVLLVMGKRENILEMHESRDFLLLEWSAEEIHSGTKAPLTAGIFALVVGLAALDFIPIVVTAFLGVAAVLLFNCINLRQATRSLDAKILLVIAASIAMGSSLQVTGGASLIASSIIHITTDISSIFVLGIIFGIMIVLTNLLSNNAAAVLFTPIALNMATQLGLPPEVFIFAVIFACNCSFVTPIGYQTNLMVMGPGHYKFNDFMKAGIPLAILMWITYVVYAQIVYDLY